MGLMLGLVALAFAALYVGVSHEQSKRRHDAALSLRHSRCGH